MKSILDDYYEKYYGRNRTESNSNETLITEATKSIDNYTYRERLKTIANQKSKIIHATSQYSKLSILPAITKDKKSVKHKKERNEDAKNADDNTTRHSIRNKRLKCNLEKEKLIRVDAKNIVKELLNEENTDSNKLYEEEEEEFNNQIIKYPKEDQIDKLMSIKQNVEYEPNNLDILKSKNIQLSKHTFTYLLSLIRML